MHKYIQVFKTLETPYISGVKSSRNTTIIFFLVEGYINALCYVISKT